MQFDFTTETITPDETNILTVAGDALELPSGTTAQRPLTASPGAIRYNTDTNRIEGLHNTVWVSTSDWSLITNAPTTLAGYGITDAVSNNLGTPGIIQDTFVNRPPAGNAGTLFVDTTNNVIQRDTGSSWITLGSAGGTVTSVDISGGTTGLTTSGGPITSNGTITLSGTLAVSHGGTGQTTQTAAFNALSPLTTKGDLVVHDGTNNVRLPIGTNGQVLTANSAAANGVEWTSVADGNASGLIGTGQTGSAAWSLVSGTLYEATAVHNLGTSNVVITLYDTSVVPVQVVLPDSIRVVDNNSFVVRAHGNTKTLRWVAVANGKSIAAGGSTPSSIIVQEEGVDVSGGPFTRINFVGSSITATNSGGGVVSVTTTQPLRFQTFYAASLDTPNNSDWNVSAFAPTVVDPTYTSLLVRQFSDTSEQGVGTLLTVPPSASSVTFMIKGRAQTAPAATRVVQHRIYVRRFPNNNAVPVWSGPIEMNNMIIPTNTNFQYFSQTFSLSSLGVNTEELFLLELTRRTTGITGGTNLEGNWLLVELSVTFT